jgi:hypothetical protein
MFDRCSQIWEGAQTGWGTVASVRAVCVCGGGVAYCMDASGVSELQLARKAGGLPRQAGRFQVIFKLGRGPPLPRQVFEDSEDSESS